MPTTVGEHTLLHWLPLTTARRTCAYLLSPCGCASYFRQRHLLTAKRTRVFLPHNCPPEQARLMKPAAQHTSALPVHCSGRALVEAQTCGNRVTRTAVRGCRPQHEGPPCVGLPVSRCHRTSSKYWREAGCPGGRRPFCCNTAHAMGCERWQGATCV